jgi:2-oxoisovalerate dehydrogenase E1 component beta subunit
MNPASNTRTATEVTFAEALTRALRDALADDERVFLLGEDVGHFGGAFGITKGLWEEFGDVRLLDTPIAEEGFVGAAFGAAWMGERPVVEIQFADFLSCAFDPIVTVGAKTHWRSGIRLPVVIRMPFGGGVRGGPFHSQSPEPWLIGVPGLKVVCPSSVADAYGLLRSAIDDEDPVVFFEHKRLYRTLRDEPPNAGQRTPLGLARVAHPGESATLVTYGAGVVTALEAVDGLDVEVIDLRTLWPYDRASVLQSVRRTSRLCVLQEAAGVSGLAGEVTTFVSANAFEFLDAPPMVISPPVTPVPFAPELEDAYIPSPTVVREHVTRLLRY